MEIRQPTMDEIRRHVADGRRMRAHFVAVGVERAVTVMRDSIYALLQCAGQNGHKSASVQGVPADVGRR